MPLNAKTVGQSTEPMTQDIDARWLMAYAAGLNDFNDSYMDTTAGDVVAHPLFPVCLEWPVLLSSRTLSGNESVTLEESARGVHASHDLHIFRHIRSGERLTTTATVIDLKAIKPGAAQATRLDTIDESGKLVCRTYQLGISREVDIIGEVDAVEAPPAMPTRTSNEVLSEWSINVGEGAAHVYTECARIFNPIHTDKSVALAAGLPDIILHGTATLALAVTTLIDNCLQGSPERVSRLGGRFTAMVLMPSTIKVQLKEESADTLFFDVLTEDGQVAFSHGYLCFK